MIIKKIKENTGILIRFDDIAPNMNWQMMDKCEKLLNEYNIQPVIGVIPKNQDKELLNYPLRKDFWNIVKKWKSKNGLSLCTVILMFMIKKLIKKIS